MRTRWDQLVQGFYDPVTDTFDSTKIPDVYDCIKYDVLHNYYFLVKLHTRTSPKARMLLPHFYPDLMSVSLIHVQMFVRCID